MTGNFGDKTEEAVLKLQEINGISMDGKVGRQTINLMYSDDVKPTTWPTERKATWCWRPRNV